MEKHDKYYGVLMSRQNINTDIYLYIPKYLITGYLEQVEENTVFRDSLDQSYMLAEDSETISFNIENSVAYVISEKELLEKYKGLSLNEAMTEYFDDMNKKIHIGFYILLSDKIFLCSYNIVNILSKLQEDNFSNASLENFEEKLIPNDQDSSKSSLSHELEKRDGDEIIPFSLEAFQEILQLDSYDKIKQKLIEVYQSYNDLNNHFLGISNKPFIKGEQIIAFFCEMCEKIQEATDIEQLNIYQRQLEQKLTGVSIFVWSSDSNDQMVCDYLYQLIDEINDTCNSSESLNSIKQKISMLQRRELGNIKQLASLYDKHTVTDNPREEKEKKDVAIATQDVTLVDAQAMKQFFDRKIIGQEEAKKVIISAIVMNQLSDSPNDRTSCLLVGPTGSGKTLIAETASEFLDLPIEIFDTTQLTVPGYVGANIEDFLARLLSKTNGDVKKAEHSIVVFDEIDKKTSQKNDDISGRGVLNTLLPFIQGTNYNVKYNGRNIIFNTSKLTIFATGAFTDVVKGKMANQQTSGYRNHKIGFNSELIPISKDDIGYPHLERKDFVTYGNMTDEIMGRLSTIAQLSGHTKESLKRILTESEISPLLAEKNKLKKLSINLYWTDTYLDSVVDIAMKLQTGARSLKSTVEDTIREARWEVLTNPDKYRGIVLSDKTVADCYDCHLIAQDGLSYNLRDVLGLNEKNKIKQKLLNH